MNTRPKAWSFSALNNFETCAKKYWHTAVAKDYKDEDGPEAGYGKQVHVAIAKNISEGTPLPLSMAHMQKFIDPYMNSAFDLMGVEMQIAVDENYMPTGWFDPDVWLRIVIDAAFEYKDIALLLDWKTGKMKDDNDGTQLKLSAAVWMMTQPHIARVASRYVWTAHGGKTTNFVINRLDIPAVFNQLMPRVKKYQEAHKRDEFPARPSGLCKKHCPVTSCPHHGGN